MNKERLLRRLSKHRLWYYCEKSSDGAECHFLPASDGIAHYHIERQDQALPSLRPGDSVVFYDPDDVEDNVFRDVFGHMRRSSRPGKAFLRALCDNATYEPFFTIVPTYVSILSLGSHPGSMFGYAAHPMTLLFMPDGATETGVVKVML